MSSKTVCLYLPQTICAGEANAVDQAVKTVLIVVRKSREFNYLIALSALLFLNHLCIKNEPTPKLFLRIFESCILL